ncbi:hypothetical protein [Actibacterium ureilyticum]|uniref:hypothetical protein n=1 Tax=Actibacterium ureilyticum TaxID=1590614 RepID=UPI000BAB0DBE|nr:hypothetical protein [Actibacterium ureilyticum]
MSRLHSPPVTADNAAYETALRHDRIAQIEHRMKRPLPDGLIALVRDFARCGGNETRQNLHRHYDLARPHAAYGDHDPVNFEWALWMGAFVWETPVGSAHCIGPPDPLASAILDTSPRGGQERLVVHLGAAGRDIPPLDGARALVPLRLAAESLTLHAICRDGICTARPVYPLPPRPRPEFPQWYDTGDFTWTKMSCSPHGGFCLAVLLEIAGWTVSPTHLSSGGRGLALSHAEKRAILTPDGQIGVLTRHQSETSRALSAAMDSLPDDAPLGPIRWPAAAPHPVIPRRVDRDGTLWCDA